MSGGHTLSNKRLSVVAAKIDALERWINYRKSRGKQGAPAPASIGGYPRPSLEYIVVN